MGQLFGSSFCSRLIPGAWPETSGGIAKSKTIPERNVASPRDRHFLIATLLSPSDRGHGILSLRTQGLCKRPGTGLCQVVPAKDTPESAPPDHLSAGGRPQPYRTTSGRSGRESPRRPADDGRSHAPVVGVRPLQLHGVPGDLLEVPGADVADLAVDVV